ncbi:MAG TPA: hypothetical protein VI542_22405 [Candidatus Tectomicrobia bacterium]
MRVISKTLAVTAGVLLSTSVVARAQTCTTRYNEVTRQVTATCSDGTTATQRYNDVTNQTQTTIRQPNGQQQRCTTTYNPVTKQARTTCK